MAMSDSQNSAGSQKRVYPPTSGPRSIQARSEDRSADGSRIPGDESERRALKSAAWEEEHRRKMKALMDSQKGMSPYIQIKAPITPENRKPKKE